MSVLKLKLVSFLMGFFDLIDLRPRYEKGDIIIVNTSDAIYGKVRVPAVVRYYCTFNNIFECYVFLCDGERIPIHGRYTHQWPIREDEIECKIGEVTLENAHLSI